MTGTSTPCSPILADDAAGNGPERWHIVWATLAVLEAEGLPSHSVCCISALLFNS